MKVTFIIIIITIIIINSNDRRYHNRCVTFNKYVSLDQTPLARIRYTIRIVFIVVHQSSYIYLQLNHRQLEFIPTRVRKRKDTAEESCVRRSPSDRLFKEQDADIDNVQKSDLIGYHMTDTVLLLNHTNHSFEFLKYYTSVS